MTGRCTRTRCPTTSSTSSPRRGCTEDDPMAEFNLPKNSRLTEGKAWPKPANAKNVTEFKISRWIPEAAAQPRTDPYAVERDDCGAMVLDALIWVKNDVDPTLAFRRSCGEGVCGSGALNMDGKNGLACTTGIDA